MGFDDLDEAEVPYLEPKDRPDMRAQVVIEAPSPAGRQTEPVRARNESPFRRTTNLLRPVDRDHGGRADAVGAGLVHGHHSPLGEPVVVDLDIAREQRAPLTPSIASVTSAHAARRLVQPPTEESVAARLLDLLIETADVRELLEQIAHLSLEWIPDCSSAGIVVLDTREAVMVATTDARARAIGAAQFSDGQGPDLEAAYGGQTVLVEDLDRTGAEGWQRVADHFGVTAVLSVPIVAEPYVPAALTLYATAEAWWSDPVVDVAEDFTEHVGSALTLAYRLIRSNDCDCPGRPGLR